MEKKSNKNGFTILTYHQIGPKSDPNCLVMSKKDFEQQMKYLSQHYRPMQLSALLEMVRRNEAIPKNAIMVTFDDGYADNFSEAFPILQKHKIPATLFITTGFIDGLKNGFRKAKVLSWDMIRQMQKSGLMELGAHTITHPNLQQCSLKKAWQEIDGSKKRIEEKTRAQVKTFAYPFGNSRSFSKQIQTLVRKAGYLGACTTLAGQNNANTNPFALRRISLAKSQIRYFALQFSELSNGILPADEIAEVVGMNKKVLALWKKRYGWLGKRLKDDDFAIKLEKNIEALV